MPDVPGKAFGKALARIETAETPVPAAAAAATAAAVTVGAAAVTAGGMGQDALSDAEYGETRALFDPPSPARGTDREPDAEPTVIPLSGPEPEAAPEDTDDDDERTTALLPGDRPTPEDHPQPEEPDGESGTPEEPDGEPEIPEEPAAPEEPDAPETNEEGQGAENEKKKHTAARIIIVILTLAVLAALILLLLQHKTDDPTEAPTEARIEIPTEAKSKGVMTYEQYVAAAVDSKVVIEAYVQAKWFRVDGKTTVYTKNADGAYFLYGMACSEADYAKLVPGTKIKVTGYKAEWAGEIEIVDAAFEIEEGSTYVAPAFNVTALLGTDDLIKHQNEFVSFKGMTVEAAAEGTDAAFLYKWDGSGSDGDDLYFKVSLNGKTYSFTVESCLCDKDSEVYAAVKNLKVGDKIDMEGFLYWYEGVYPHITSVKSSQADAPT